MVAFLTMKHFCGKAKNSWGQSGISDYKLQTVKDQPQIVLRGTFLIEELLSLIHAAQTKNLEFELPETIKDNNELS